MFYTKAFVGFFRFVTRFQNIVVKCCGMCSTGLIVSSAGITQTIDRRILFCLLFLHVVKYDQMYTLN